MYFSMDDKNSNHSKCTQENFNYQILIKDANIKVLTEVNERLINEKKKLSFALKKAEYKKIDDENLTLSLQNQLRRQDSLIDHLWIEIGYYKDELDLTKKVLSQTKKNLEKNMAERRPSRKTRYFLPVLYLFVYLCLLYFYCFREPISFRKMTSMELIS